MTGSMPVASSRLVVVPQRFDIRKVFLPPARPLVTDELRPPEERNANVGKVGFNPIRPRLVKGQAAHTGEDVDPNGGRPSRGGRRRRPTSSTMELGLAGRVLKRRQDDRHGRAGVVRPRSPSPGPQHVTEAGHQRDPLGDRATDPSLAGLATVQRYEPDGHRATIGWHSGNLI